MIALAKNNSGNAQKPFLLDIQEVVKKPVKLHDWSLKVQEYAQSEGKQKELFGLALNFIKAGALYRYMVASEREWSASLGGHGEIRVADMRYTGERQGPNGEPLPEIFKRPSFDMLLKWIVAYLPSDLIDSVYESFIHTKQKEGESVLEFRMRLDESQLILSYARDPAGCRRIEPEDITEKLLWGLHDKDESRHLRRKIRDAAATKKPWSYQDIFQEAKRREERARYKQAASSNSAGVVAPMVQSGTETQPQIVAALQAKVSNLEKQLNAKTNTKSKGKGTSSAKATHWFESSWTKEVLTGNPEKGTPEWVTAVKAHVDQPHIQALVKEATEKNYFKKAGEIVRDASCPDWNEKAVKLREAIPAEWRRKIFVNHLTLTGGKPNLNMGGGRGKENPN